jgi:hypothetical protein
MYSYREGTWPGLEKSSARTGTRTLKASALVGTIARFVTAKRNENVVDHLERNRMIRRNVETVTPIPRANGLADTTALFVIGRKRPSDTGRSQNGIAAKRPLTSASIES